ncbi:MAG: ABC transporter permease, partial [Planctomycetota bacterium]
LAGERRARVGGLMLAVGFSPGMVRRAFVFEGGMVAGIGAIVGAIASAGYAKLMLVGLQTLWTDAVGGLELRLHVSMTSVVIGAVGAWMVMVGAVVLSLRELSRWSARSLLSGAVSTGGGIPSKPSGRSGYVGVASLVLAIGSLLLPMMVAGVQEAIGFFLGGMFAVVAALSGLSYLLPRMGRWWPVLGAGRFGLCRLAIRNMGRNSKRSLLTAGLIASATFVLAAVGVFRLKGLENPHERESGAGGFALIAESAAPVVADLNTAEGRELAGVTDDGTLWNDIQIQPFRLKEGDETSCLSTYQATSPRILGARPSMIERGGFAFAESLATTADERAIPWLLLNRTLEDGAIPVIGDAAAVRWQLHRSLGADFVMADERGQEIRLRFVALLQESTLQSELIVSEANFVRLFPSLSGYRFFMVETPAGREKEISAAMERSLSRVGLDTTLSTERYRAYAAVQNTYLSAFQLCGGFGLILGGAGLVAVVLRNVLERRGELAIFQALGFSRKTLGRLVQLEHVFLFVCGLLAGLVPAGIAVAPQVIERPSLGPWVSTLGILTAILIAGIGATFVALFSTARQPILSSLRSEGAAG